MTTAAALLLAGLIAPPAGGGSIPGTTQETLELRLELSTTRLARGQSLGLKLVVHNPSEEPIRMIFPTACQENFIIRRGQETVWELEAGRMCALMMSERTLEPGATVAYEATWDQSSSDGALVPAGEYLVSGELLSRPRRSTGEQTLTVYSGASPTR